MVMAISNIAKTGLISGMFIPRLCMYVCMYVGLCMYVCMYVEVFMFAQQLTA